MKKTLRRIFYRSIDNKEILYKNLKEFMKNKIVFLIDVRSNQEYEEGHLADAILIPLYDLEEEIEQKAPNKQKTIVLYCSSGVRSKQAKTQLEQMGYSNVFHIKGGLNDIN